jgi:hypothetical protein
MRPGVPETAVSEGGGRGSMAIAGWEGGGRATDDDVAAELSGVCGLLRLHAAANEQQWLSKKWRESGGGRAGSAEVGAHAVDLAGELSCRGYDEDGDSRRWPRRVT